MTSPSIHAISQVVGDFKDTLDGHQMTFLFDNAPMHAIREALCDLTRLVVLASTPDVLVEADLPKSSYKGQSKLLIRFICLLCTRSFYCAGTFVKSHLTCWYEMFWF